LFQLIRVVEKTQRKDVPKENTEHPNLYGYPIYYAYLSCEWQEKQQAPAPPPNEVEFEVRFSVSMVKV
jgi:hypothetical protein